MAACQVDIVGTSGSLIINYKLGTSPNTITCNFGDLIWIDDSATDLTYSTLSGDAVPSSLCLMFTSEPITFYQFEWGGLLTVFSPNLVFSELIYDIENIAITNAPLSTGKTSYYNLAQRIISLNDSRFTPTSGIDIFTSNFKISKLVIKTIGNYIPELKIFDSVNNLTYYITPTVSVEVPTGFNPIS